MFTTKNFVKKFLLLIIYFSLNIFITCKSESEEHIENNIHQTEQKHADSLVKSDKERADSMLKALKEKMK